MFKNILLALDGSEHALRAAIVAGDMARTLKADLRVLVAYEPLSASFGEPILQTAITERISQAEKILNTGLEEVGEIPGTLKTEILEGPAAEAILSVADVRRIDLIVMGARGLSRLAGLLVGSVSQKIVAHANCPVLLIR